MHDAPDHSASFGELSDAFNRQDWTRAYQMAKDLLRQIPGHPLLHYIAGASSLELRQMPQALANLKQASELAPGRPDFAILYAKALSMAHLRVAALAVAEKARASVWNDARALDVLGVIYTQAGTTRRRTCSAAWSNLPPNGPTIISITLRRS